MIYRGYEITASAKTYVTWALDDEGEPHGIVGRDDGEIGGYFAREVKTDEEMDFIDGSRIDAALSQIDWYIDEEKDDEDSVVELQ